LSPVEVKAVVAEISPPSKHPLCLETDDDDVSDNSNSTIDIPCESNPCIDQNVCDLVSPTPKPHMDLNFTKDIQPEIKLPTSCFQKVFIL
jgi:hypothetical protein